VYRQVVDVDIRATADGDSGYKVIVAGSEWIEYTLNVTGGTYDLHARVATPRDGGNKITVKLGGKTLGSLAIPNTGSWETFTTVTIPSVTVAGGTGQVLRLELDGVGWHLNWVEMLPAGSAVIRDVRELPVYQFGQENLSIFKINGINAGIRVHQDLAGLGRDLPSGMYIIKADMNNRTYLYKLLHTR
jgi:hypothetical protein